MANSRKRLNVVSLSFDGCVYHSKYDYTFEGEPSAQNPFNGTPNIEFDRLVVENQALIQSITRDVKAGNFQEVVWMVGCLRQDSMTELAKMQQTQRESCLFDLPILGAEVSAGVANAQLTYRIDPYLLADAYGILANYDAADLHQQDEAKCLEAEAFQAADRAEAAANEAEDEAARAAVADKTGGQLRVRAKKAKSNKQAEDFNREATSNEAQALQHRAASEKLKSESLSLRAKANELREQAKALRPQSYGYGINANDDSVVVRLRERILSLRRKATVAGELAGEAVKRGDLKAAKDFNQEANAHHAEMKATFLEPYLYTRAMQVGDTWKAMMVAREIKKLRQIAAARWEYAKQEDAAAAEAKSKTREYEQRNHESLAAHHRDQARVFLDQANVLCLGPYVVNIARECESAREAILAARHDPDKKHEHAFHFAEWFVDASKLTILYAQMHRQAARHPEAEIVFDFYESRSDVLKSLEKFMKANRDLMPGNVVLRCHQYVGRDPIHFHPIKGKGPIDYHYHQNVREMVQCAGFNLLLKGSAPTEATLECPDLGVLSGFSRDVRRLKAFKKQRQFLSDTVQHFQPGAHQLGVFDPKLYLQELYDEIEKFPDDEHHAELRQALGMLYFKLQDDLVLQVQKGLPPKKIQQSAAREIATDTCRFLHEFHAASHASRSEVTQQFIKRYQSKTRCRNFFKILAVIAAAALGLVVGAVIGVGVGVASGLLTGPGALGTGVLGMFAGASAGTLAGISIGASLTGLGAGTVAKIKLFGVRPDENTLAVKNVMNAAKSYVKSAAIPADAGDVGEVAVLGEAGQRPKDKEDVGSDRPVPRR